jgi:hypothetical protein
LLPLASFGGAPYSVDEAGVVKCVVKAGCAVGARLQISDQMSIDLSHIDGYDPIGDLARPGCPHQSLRSRPRRRPRRRPRIRPRGVMPARIATRSVAGGDYWSVGVLSQVRIAPA